MIKKTLILSLVSFLFLFTANAELATGEVAPGRPPVEGASSARVLSRAETCRQLAADNPDLNDSINLEGGSAPSINLLARAKKCVAGVGDAWADTVRTLIVDPAKYMFVTSVEETMRYLRECNASMECKKGLFYEAHGREPNATDLQNLASISDAQLDVLHRNAMSRMNSSYMQNQRLMDSMKNQQWLDSNSGTPSNETERGSFWSLVRSKIESERTKWSCLTPEAAQELACYYIAMVVDPTIALGMVSAAPKLAKLVGASAKVADGATAARVTIAAEDTTKMTRAARLARNARLTDIERIAEAEKVIGRPLTPGQRQALLDAHNVGNRRSGSGIGNYTQAEINEKARILRTAGFDVNQTRALISEGLAGRQAGVLVGEVRLGMPPVRTQLSLDEARLGLKGVSPSYALTKPQTARQFESAKEYYDAVGYATIKRGGDRTAARDPFLNAGNVDAYMDTFRTRSGEIIEGQNAVLQAEINRLTLAKQQMRRDQARAQSEAVKHNSEVTLRRENGYEYPRAEMEMYSSEYMTHMDRIYNQAIQQLKEEMM